MGNSCGAMHKYTELTDKDPLYQGGFLWDYIDQSIDRRNRYGEEFQAYGGDFGDRPCDYNFCGNGIAYAGDRKPSPKMQEVKYNYQSIEIKIDKITAEIRNKNLFINTNVYDCFIILQINGKLIKEVTMETDIPPLTQRTYTLPIEEQKEIGEYAVTVSFRLKEKCSWADAGYEVAFGQGIYMVNQKDAQGTPKEIKSLKVIHGKWNIGVRGEHFEALFSYLNGGLVSYRYGGTELIKAIPKPNFWRAPTDNDRGNNMSFRYAQWKIASMYLSHKKDNEILPPVLEEQEGCAVIKYTYMMPTTPESNCELTYTVYGDGTVAVRLTYDPVRELGDMPEFGMIFKFDAAYDQVEWYGLGPEDSYWDRKKGARLGIYHNEVSGNLASYLVPQECGNKTEVRYAKVMDRKGRGIIFSGETLNFSALPFTPHELENVSHAYELPRVHYTVVRVSKQQMGIGGDDSWGAKTHEEYLIDISKKLEFAFSFKGI
jgi:beta-galactosidase